MGNQTLPLQASWVRVTGPSGRVHMEQRWIAPASAAKADPRPATKHAA